MKPYYESGGITIFHGDCRDVLPALNADVLITDPPYGVELGIDKDIRAGKHGLARKAYDIYIDSYDNFVSIVVPVLSETIQRVRRAAVFTGPHIQEQPKATAIGGVYCPAGSGRHAWGFKTFLPVLFYGTDPLLHHGARPNVLVSSAVAERNGHPCPKPLEWLRWLVSLVSLPDEVIIDPFLGSGSTLRAAKDLGRRAIGVELSESYCEVAARRLMQEAMVL